MSHWITPIMLADSNVQLEPMQQSHREQLVEAAEDGKLWQLWYTSIPSAETIDAYMQSAFDAQKAGTQMPFVVIEKASNKLIGSTRYLHVNAEHRRLEIGNTWYAASAQRTVINAACKMLLLTHAFEQLNAIGVEFRTHWHNNASRQAIARLGAKQDGVLRNHQIDSEGIYRDTVVFSIIESEWPAVKRGLQLRLSK